MPGTRPSITSLACAALLVAAQAYQTLQHPALADHRTPVIAIVIDDMGDRLEAGLRATRLSGPVANAILPGTPFSKRLAEEAHKHGKEVLLHLPMESTQGNPLGPGGITLHMTHTEFLNTVEKNLAAVPYVVGINNHMGSLLTQHPGHMQWLMELIQSHPQLFFIDSRTTERSVAQQVAHEHSIPNSKRDIFLDDDPDPEAVIAQFERLIAVAKRTGTAVGIGHPYPATLELLEEHLPDLVQRHGVKLVPLSDIITLQQNEGRLWHASSSPSPKVAKSSKPLPSSICCAAQGSKLYAPALTTAR